MEDVGGSLHEFCTVADQLMAAACERIVDGPGDCKHLSTLLERMVSSDQGSAAACRLDDERAERQAADDAVALGKMGTQGWRARRELRDQGARLRQALRQALVC